MSEQNITASLKAAVIGWAFMDLLGIPLAVGVCSAMAIKNPLKHTSFL